MHRNLKQRYARLLALDPCTKGFGFAVFESSGRLLDWGVARVQSKSDEAFCTRLDAMTDRYAPSLILFEGGIGTRRSLRAVRRLALAGRYAKSHGIDTRAISRADVRARFEDTGTTKHEIAVAIARLFPELEQYLPPLRKPWMSEDDRMNIFDAVALAVTVFDGFSERKRAA